MKTVCFGEIMLRLNPAGYTRFIQTDTFGATYGGGEANVAVSLANYGIDASYVTKLPSHEIGQSAVNSLRRYGVDTSDIVRGGERVGIYYLETGASQRPSKVIYDRAYSAIALAKRSDFDWERILDGANWFHFTGITPALGGELPEICMDALKVCRQKGITTSCDLNYRKNLWSTEEAGRVMGELMKLVDVCIANEEDAEKVFGIKAENTDVDAGVVNHEELPPAGHDHRGYARHRHHGRFRLPAYAAQAPAGHHPPFLPYPCRHFHFHPLPCGVRLRVRGAHARFGPHVLHLRPPSSGRYRLLLRRSGRRLHGQLHPLHHRPCDAELHAGRRAEP